jgi:hypothetical protein
MGQFEVLSFNFPYRLNHSMERSANEKLGGLGLVNNESDCRTNQ